jgi:hypothetical protein
MALAIGTSTFLSVAASTPQDTPLAPPGVDEAVVETSAFGAAVATLDRDLSGPITAAADETTARRFSRTMAVTAVLLAVITAISWWLIGPRRRQQ